jgi:PAS domain S-box-containing protein
VKKSPSPVSYDVTGFLFFKDTTFRTEMTTTTRRPLTTCSEISLLLIYLLLFTAIAGYCAAESKVPTAPRKLVAAIPVDLPPTYFLDNSGKPAGFAVDVMSELAQRMGLTVEYVSGQTFDDVIQMVLTGKADLIPSLTIDERRKELLVFTDTVGFLPANLFVASGNLKTQGISPGLTIGVVKGSAPENFLMKNQAIRLTIFTNPQTMLFELLAGRVDGIVFLTPNLMKLAIDAGVEDKIKVVGEPIIEGKRGIALRKGDTELLTRLNTAIGEFIGSPEYQQIYIKWYGKPKPYWTADKIGAVSGVLLVLIVCGMAFWRYRSIVRLNNRLTLTIIERKQTEEALRKSEERFRSLFEQAAVGVAEIITETGQFITVNHRLCECVGRTEEELLATSFQSITHPEDYSLHDGKTQMMLAGEIGHYTLEKRYLRKDGEIVWVNITVSPLRKPGEEPGSNMIVVEDITDRKRAEEELRKSEGKYRNILESIEDGYFEVDIAGSLTFFNDSVCRMLETTRDEVTGINYRRYTDKENSRILYQAFNKVFTTGEPSKGVGYEIIGKDGAKLYIESSVSLVKNSLGQPIGFRGIMRNITERKNAEKQLQDTLESLRKAVGTTIQVLASAVEARDPYTAGHQIRSADLARTIAAEMGLSQDKIEGIRIAGSIHDIGKLSIPAEILSKPTRLSEIEFALIKAHSQRGFEMIKDVKSPWPLAEIVHQHHERMDGSGYPRNLKGEEILIEARILCVADVVEAMASHRPYRPGLGIDAALNEIEKNRGIFYDNAVADACLKLFREKGFKLAET